MPTRQELLNALRQVSEEVMQSLRMLMTIIFALTMPIEPETEVTPQELSPINQLIQEVTQQRSTIEQLGQVITQRLSHPEPRPASVTASASMPSAVNPVQANGMNSTLITMGTPLSVPDILSEEELSPEMPPPRRVTAAPPMTSPAPSSSNARTTMSPPTVRNTPPAPAAAVAAIAGIGLPANNNQALMPTANALELWGDKRCTWGKKHSNKTYRQIYEEDPGYNQWVLDRPNLQGDISDYANYATTRKHLEQTLREATR